MNVIDDIRSPIWNGGKPHIGIADFKIKDGMNRVELTYKRKSDGLRSYPNPFYIEGEKARQYPTQTVSGGVVLHIIPLEDFEEGVLTPEGYTQHGG